MVAERKPGTSRGLLRPLAPPRHFHFARYLPSPDLAPFIEHFWTVAWDLLGQPPHVQSTLPFPSVHVVLDRGRSVVVGVITKKFTPFAARVRGAIYAKGLEVATRTAIA